jgi:hypothetical protein
MDHLLPNIPKILLLQQATTFVAIMQKFYNVLTVHDQAIKQDFLRDVKMSHQDHV